tara:strand:- start:661 stop:1281 length:621 start_codon:yes stop_codon:yes gene_type:complete
MKSKKKIFISFEGPEASGKSSQIKLLSNYLNKNKIPHIITREPGGTNISEKLRKIILNKNYNISSTEELLLLMAARLNHINNVIFPALNKGKIVISDRFADSTFVYQGYLNNYGLNKSIDLHKKLLNNFLPSKTFLFLLPPNEINKRLRKRKISNKYDKINPHFHQKVINGYKTISKNNNRFIKIDATKSISIIHEQIINDFNKII